VPKAEIHVLDAGHFALDEKADKIAAIMCAFLKTLAAEPRSARPRGATEARG
jgi:hypothetical protein